MNKFITTLLAFVVVFSLLTPSAFAWRSVRTGQKNFERAWQAYTMLQNDKATKFFKKSADAYAEALAADPPSKTARYVSNLTMAGMAFYHAGRFQECIDTMELASRKESKIWETNIFIGLAQAKLGDNSKALESLNVYLKSMPSQRTLSASVTQQLENLENGSVSLPDAIGHIDNAMQSQFIDNINRNNSRSTNPSNERCSGPLWWRQNRAPCEVTGYGLNSM